MELETMRVAMLTVLRWDMLQQFKHSRSLGVDIDVLIKGNEPAHERAYIGGSNLTERIYNPRDLMHVLKEYDVITAYEFYGQVQAEIMRNFGNFVPEVAWNMPSYGTFFGFTNWHAECLSLARRKVPVFLARSQGVVDCMVQEGIELSKIRRVWGSCDTDIFKPRPKPVCFKNKLVFLFIGRMQEQKGIFELFHGFYRAAIPNSVLVMLGKPHPTNPWDYNQVRKWAKICGIEERVIFEDAVKPELVHCYYNWGDVFVTLPNSDVKFKEQVGMTTPQAMASGLPVITYDYGGQSEFVHDAGILVPHKDYVAVAEAMRRLAVPKLRNKMKDKARKIAVAAYDVQYYAEDTKAAYEEAMA
jgi:glycosyltransferase involved in cell wall biosynthesis